MVNLLNTCGENEVTETVLLEDLAKEVADDTVQENKDLDEPENDTAQQLPSLLQQNDALSMDRRVLDSYGCLSEGASKALFQCQRVMKHERSPVSYTHLTLPTMLLV